ncbi:MAG: sigma-54-dependent Fis family transcriptional regulator [Proteobacteria bacterium]|nr:sigma-54-dependent Fis family transcriptional regulator [Pseudomonadota bacterium]NDD03596.1 sigma-54-dependent Fis family transcriptional regulator [Pseudomonadota bacterium]NDG26008.1 sigma-54-dependent Fis family transcriptional regulator [Pseudomonadota bacterium]
MRAGASDFWDSNQEIAGLLTVIEENLGRIISTPPDLSQNEFSIPQFVGRHPKILEIFQLIMSIKDTDSNVLITGESGTGKEVVARAIHDLSPRKKLPLIAVNCGAIPATLLESELFGHMKGAFTGATQNRIGRFQLAGQGTLFLDEISDLSLDLQSKILRAIQQKVYEPVGSAHSLYLNARIIAASNQNLETAVGEKRFREDLYYRLNVIPINIPPLRDRKSDIPLLVKAFTDKFASQYAREVTGVSEDSLRILMQYHWPGNIRELENLIERVVILKRDKGIIDVKDLPIEHFKRVTLDRYISSVSLPDNGLDLNDAINDFENELIIQALQKTQGNKNKAAYLLNLNRTTLVEKLKRKGLKLAC